MEEFVALYARISKRDPRREAGSGSISNQLQLLRRLQMQDEELSAMTPVEFQDDGYTGTREDRPAFQKLMAGIYLGKIRGVIVKDLSRLSRNHLFLSHFRERICPRYHVVLLSVGDGYDSRQEWKAELGAGIRSIFYEYYCCDVSHKVKQSLEARKREGHYAAGKAPYGYRHSDDRKTLKIWEPEAKVVRQIYDRALQGENCAQIARWLNRQGGHRWEAAGVWRILNHPVYCGHHVWHKTENCYFSGFFRESVPREQWREERNCYPAVVPEEEYQKVQQLQRRTQGTARRKRHYFHGITRCGDCGAALCRHRRRREFLCCNRCSQGRERIALDALWRVCAAVFLTCGPYCTADWEEEGEEWAREEFLQRFMKEIQVSAAGEIWIRWKFVS